MPFDTQLARPLLQTCELAKLFVEELGWEPCRQKLTLRVADQNYAFTALAEKRGFVAWLCESPGGGLPDRAIRLRLDRKLSETSFEHLIVFVPRDHSSQSWTWVRREPGKPLAARTHEYRRGQPGDSLLQKLQALYVSLEEEEAGELSTVAVAGRARAAFDVEKVTKAFYRDFDTHRKAFLGFIEGIGEAADREWYASVMLNRLMFVYFIQRKGFLDGDRDYLRHRLDRCQKEQGADKFYTFYRYFLLRLFHEGFGKRRSERAPDLEKLLGTIPYLNGGLFDVHELEKPERYDREIQIPDQAFARVFDYFDRYQWHLDERPLRNDNEINPDVLGYIFEKYINQKQMGAYYTKEDITEYIGKNTVIPFLFDAARAKCRVAFEGSAGVPPAGARDGSAGILPAGIEGCGLEARAPVCTSVWGLLSDDPDRYIYPAVRHGVNLPLPPEIAIGIDTDGSAGVPPACAPSSGQDARAPALAPLRERRKEWNKPAPAAYALPTEIWREVVARRQRCEEVRGKLGRGEVSEINDLITLNLDIRQFAQDVIESCEGPDLLAAFWQAVSGITILDPTGGSGAFIFAALNILDPLYEACLDRMEAFLAEWDGSAIGPAAGAHDGSAGIPPASLKTCGQDARAPVRAPLRHPNYHKRFSEVLARVAAHPNRRYFVLKSIILNNLYAVDIMEEAVEICKLRLFLKLAAQVEPDPGRDNLGIEPLPDIDFNIRAGNTLVGYATADEVRQAFTQFANETAGVGGKLSTQGRLLLGEEADAFAAFNVRCADVQQAFDTFRHCQTDGDGTIPVEHKRKLRERLAALDDELNRHLASEYGIERSAGVPPAAAKKCGQDARAPVTAYAKWLKTHQPFHWFVQFYGIMNTGGFDVIIGNPPYVEYRMVRGTYRLQPSGYLTETSENLYAFCMERSCQLLRTLGSFGMIVPAGVLGLDETDTLREVLMKRFSDSWCSTYAIRPAKLFEGVDQRLCIYLGCQTGKEKPVLSTTRYQHWNSGERLALLSKIEYTRSFNYLRLKRIPQLGSITAAGILTKLEAMRQKPAVYYYSSDKHGILMHYHRSPRYWIRAMDFEQYFRSPTKARSVHHFRDIHFADVAHGKFVGAVLNSSLFFFWFVSVGNGRNITGTDVEQMPVGDVCSEVLAEVATVFDRLMINYEQNSFVRKRQDCEFQEFKPSLSKPILDEIDTLLARHYGFTEEELDFIINYDIKYRMGRDAGEGE